MAVLGKTDLLEKLKVALGDNATSDEGIAFIEDVTDTLGDFEEKTKDSTDWKTKYEENDKTWRKKYSDRFFNKPADNEDNHDDFNDDEGEKPKKFEDLFKEETK